MFGRIGDLEHAKKQAYAQLELENKELKSLLRGLWDYLDNSPAASAMHWCEEIEKALSVASQESNHKQD